MSTLVETLPHQSSKLFLTDGGLETSLIFLEGEDLPLFAAFTLLRTAAGRAKLQDYFRPYIDLAVRSGSGFVLESPTWRANPDWAGQLGYSATALDAANREAIESLQALAQEYRTPQSPFVISGCIGPRGDGYVAGAAMSVEEARAYHARQIAVFAESGADMVSAITMTNVPEATGVALAARDSGIASVISFTVETDGRLPSGDDLGDAIRAVDAATGGSVAYFMINCAHPTHFAEVLEQGGEWVKRICGIRANASRMSHEELDAAEELDSGDPHDLAQRYAAILDAMPWVRVVGGCCGTDHRHISAICSSCCGHEAAA
ncbi:homocysteine S-methyltransferase family protein [Roseibium sp. Sym1]|uniref:homocysteine S-methyltransferase family protein n=1 Tax=Roseibium sp. Sym1 TaxID=3016006 RepID=UPI0022B3A074|nr:homocysteine S-methyltransferase family protein [Roseibium sp. Sym1]